MKMATDPSNKLWIFWFKTGKTSWRPGEGKSLTKTDRSPACHPFLPADHPSPSPITSPLPPFYGCREGWGGDIISPHPRLLPFLLFIHFIDIKARSYVTWKIAVVGLFFSTFRFLSRGAAVFIFRRGHFIYLRECFRHFMDLRVYVFSNVGRLLDVFSVLFT